MSVILVQWTKSNSSKGRIVRLDSDDCIICPVNFASVASCFANTDIIMPAVGEGVRRVRKKDRPKLPNHPLRLMKMYAQAISLHSLSDQQVCFEEDESAAAVRLTCAVCGCTSGSVRLCAFCLVPCHAECFQRADGCASVLQRMRSVDVACHARSHQT